MKQTIHKFLLLTLLAMVGVINAAADECYLDGICYNLDASKKTAEVRKNDKEENTGSIVIPSKITYKGAEYSVTSIGWCAFNGCSGLTSVTIPESVTSIGGSAFNGCSGLESITIPNSITRVGDYAFQYCENLKEVHISDLKAWCNITYDTNRSTNPLYYAKHLYLNGNEVKNLVIPDGITSINGHIFEGCVSFESVTIPKSVTSIGEYAFKNCSSLKSVTIPNTVTSIGEFAFGYCSGLKSVTIHEGVTTIGDQCFFCCSGLESITIPNSVTSVGGVYSTVALN